MPTEGGEFRSAHTYSPLYGNFIRGTCVPRVFYQKKKEESFVIKRYSILLENLVVSISRLDIFYLHEKEREREREYAWSKRLAPGGLAIHLRRTDQVTFDKPDRYSRLVDTTRKKSRFTVRSSSNRLRL